MKKTSALVEGAIMTAVYLILLLISLYVPLINLFSMLLLPIPILLVVCRQGLQVGFLSAAVASVLSLLVAGVLGGFMGVMFALIGVVIGELYRRKKSAFAVLLGTSLAFVVSLLGLLVFMKVVLDINLIQQGQQAMNEMITQFEKMYKVQDPSVFKPLREAISLMPIVLPSSILIGSLLIAIVVQWLSTLFLKRLRIPFQALPPVREWNVPRGFLWLYLLTIVLMFTNPEQGSTLHALVLNAFSLLSLVLAVQGFSVIFHFFYVKQWSRAGAIWTTVAIVILSPFFALLMEFVRILGILDLGFGLKQRTKKRQ
ncbi:hypothetical protein A374_07296 [Fictibacillus macauensis ZFHKF-1]|uniref:DUF2232 domain-containing protein n=1 Tax=Fictibacillus macauensis ZFHKF-1 TaxID=1196324 RepID=I8AJY1_9BACL|nr:YybS family protein [Fictibacillus macauensis]EIT86107.1 hypothetical protein A374_07296 [Fictibacillus macauensis ZFHKF-1]